MNDITLSKFLSLILRHHPGRVGLSLDAQGWAPVDDLLGCLARAGKGISRTQLEQLVRGNDKKRFCFSDDGRRIRASQGHSIEVDLGLAPLTPPEILYHGTATRSVPSIRQRGILPDCRRHVHLSSEAETAVDVGARHGKPCVLTVSAAAMHAEGHSFFRSENGVWLTDEVPPQFLGEEG